MGRYRTAPKLPDKARTAFRSIKAEAPSTPPVNAAFAEHRFAGLWAF